MQAIKKPSETQEVADHLGHVDYPITGKDFMAACNNMSDTTREQREWVKQNIDENRTYNNQEEIRTALKL